MTNQENIERLTKLLDNPDYQEITKREAQFNIFDALGTKRQELRHSDFLAYILDPIKPHGLHQKFLRQFLILVTSNKHNHSNTLNPINVRLDNFDNVRVYREKHRYDLMLHYPDQWLFIIENKVGASLSENQLEKYRENAEINYPNIEKHFLYLTPIGEEPSDKYWEAISYKDIYLLIYNFTKTEKIPERTLNALLDYNSFLETHVIEDSKVADLCRKIYREHRDAIELILSHADSPRDLLKKAVISTLTDMEKDGLILTDSIFNGMPRFIDTRWEKSAPNIDINASWTNSKKGILLEWMFTSTELRIDLVVGPINETTRSDLISFLCNQSSQFKDSGGKYFNHISKSSVIALDDTEQWTDESDTLEFRQYLKKRTKEILDFNYQALREYF